ncbi:thiamine phosphate synthase [Marinimicrobium sp. ABcell2]|uniref:thiamine phosphate synthase n=1 Tax=Marinimicrobium sp. ABcell2 TaxID=3069751 RepID=UPI0027B06EB9|nr:thiamine phosphate synthase [Marinimicrobium sp. ABcell2]MDQ2075724.1 thiamine phosphate synthase [Marinimicrobium sp. ABcell2]
MLYAITDSQLLPGEHLYAAVAAALRGGCRRVQYRDKSSVSSVRTHQAATLLTLCCEHGAELIINDDVRLALNVGAHGVHLGQEDMPLAQARSLLGADAIIGVTCHASLDLARLAVQASADYVAFGRFFPSSTKPDAPPAPLSLLTDAHQTLGLPIVAIGGITLDNAHSVLASGADWLAVSHSLFSAPDIEARARAFFALADNRISQPNKD